MIFVNLCFRFPLQGYGTQRKVKRHHHSDSVTQEFGTSLVLVTYIVGTSLKLVSHKIGTSYKLVTYIIGTSLNHGSFYFNVNLHSDVLNTTNISLCHCQQPYILPWD